MKKMFSQKGFTLVEILIYVSILAIISGVVVVFIFQTLGVNESSRRSRETLDNARRSLDIISQEVRHAKRIYVPTSCFVSNPSCTTVGQLSLETTRDLPANEESIYVDFYVDNGGLFMRREGQAAQLLTSETVTVTNLTFTNLTNSSGTGSVQIKIGVQYNEASSRPGESTSLVTTASLRSY